MTADIAIVADADAFARIAAEDVRALTRAATDSTFYRDDLTPEQVADNGRIVSISGPTAEAAARNDHQRFAAAMVGGRFAGFVVATRHGPGDHELDWLMVSPDHHGTPVSRALMAHGMAWLGLDSPIWLTVIRHNERAIRFYRRFGFEIDPATELRRVVPGWVMRRPAGGIAPMS